MARRRPRHGPPGAAVAEPTRGVPRRPLASALALRVALFGLLWVVLTRQPAESWPYGIAVVGLALWLSLIVLPPPRRLQPFAPRGLVLVPLVLWEAVRSGWDVALRAFRPSRPLDPDFMEYRFRHPSGLVPVALGYLVNILPGTLVVDIEGDTMRIHVIDRQQANEARVARLERWLIWAFGGRRRGAARWLTFTWRSP